MLSPCKTTRRSFLLGDTEDIREVKWYCINSVVTALLYRGHGLASYLLQNVAQWLDGPGEAAVSLLYSGIPHFYGDLDWTVLPNTEIILSNRPWLQDIQQSYANLEVRSLNVADINRLCTQDTEMPKVEAQRTKVTAGENGLTVLPTSYLVECQHASFDYIGIAEHLKTKVLPVEMKHGCIGLMISEVDVSTFTVHEHRTSQDTGRATPPENVIIEK